MISRSRGSNGRFKHVGLSSDSRRGKFSRNIEGMRDCANLSMGDRTELKTSNVGVDVLKFLNHIES